MICNTGIGLIPRVDGQIDYFSEKGLYDGLFLMSDERTGTYWHHMTGEAVYGPLTGKRLELENVLHTTVEQILEESPDALVAISDHPRAMDRRERGGTLSWLLHMIKGVPDMFPATMGSEDDRRPRMDMGIGIWNDSGQRYYPMETVREKDDAILDTFGGRKVLVYYDPTAYALVARYTEADRVRWDEKVLHLSTGDRIEKGVLLAQDGSRAQGERPLQVFTRWYGFSLTFPETELYGQ